MKLKKIITATFHLCLVALMTACSDSVPSEDFGPSPEANTDGVFFHAANTVYMAKAKNDTIHLTIGRSKTSSAQSYQFVTNVTDSTGTDAKNHIIVPESVSFGSGEDRHDIDIIMTDLDYDMPYTVEMKVSDKDATPYATGTQKFTVTCEDPDAWEVVTKKAVFVNNFWSSILSGSTTMYGNVTVKKYRGKNIFRIYDLPMAFREEWTQYYQMAPDCELTVDAQTYPIEIDCDKYSQPNSRIKKVYMPFQSLGVKLGELSGSPYTVGEVWAGSVAYNLMSATTGDYISEAMYPLGTYDTQTGVFKFGKIAVDYGDDAFGIQLCQGETALYLDESKMEVDIRDLLFTNIRRATFNSKAYLDQNGYYMSQGTKLGQCSDSEYEDAQYTFRIQAPYTAGHDLYFTHKNGRVKFLDGQLTGSTTLGGYPIYCESKTSSYIKNDQEEKYVFNMNFYYINDKSERYDLGTFEEELVMGSTITYYTADDLIRDKSIDEYVGEWSGEFVYVSDQNTTVRANVSIKKDDQYTLIIRGLAPYMESQNGYDSSLYLDWNDETGTFDFLPQYANTFNQYQINVYTADLDNPNSELYDLYNLRVGFLKDGRLAFVNNPDNAVPVNCAVFYTPASGGALVEPFVPYNLVLERVSETAKPSHMPSLASNMVPWSSFKKISNTNRHSNGTPVFNMGGSNASNALKLLKMKKTNLMRK